ncbi:hypothetical protein ACFL96_01935 [Thermoproteota archaeon]
MSIREYFKRIAGIGFFVLVFLSCNSLYPAELRLEKYHQGLYAGFKAYNISSDEQIGLVGVKLKHNINKYLYWGEFGYGAVAGKRGGFLEGGLLVGLSTVVSKAFSLGISVMAGAGGGGSAPQGGGLIVNPAITAGWRMSNKDSITIDIGYIWFLNGNIESITVGIHYQLNYWLLGVK